MKLDGWWEEGEMSISLFHIHVNSSTALCQVPGLFSLWSPVLWATELQWIFVSLLWKPAKHTLLTTCSLSNTRQLPRLIFFAFSSCWFMAFPYVAIKLLESPLWDELMPLKYISVSCTLMVLLKNKGGVGAAWFLLKFSFPLLFKLTTPQKLLVTLQESFANNEKMSGKYCQKTNSPSFSNFPPLERYLHYKEAQFSLCELSLYSFKYLNL